MTSKAVLYLTFFWLALAIAAPAQAAEDAAAYPTKPVTYIIPFGAGGESDIAAQLQQPYFKGLTGQDLVIKRRPGGGGAVVWNELNNMPGNGYIIAGINLPHIALQPVLGAHYKTRDITGVYLFHYTPDAIVVREDSPYDTLQELIDDARRQPGSVVFSGSGRGTANHLAHIRFDKMADIKTLYRPFKGTGASITALMLEAVDASWGYLTVGLNYEDDVRLLAIATEKRHPMLPDVPTFRELGFDLTDGAYRGIAVPKSTPDAVRQRISDIFGEINANPTLRTDAENLGFAPVDIPYGEVAKFIEKKRQDYLELAKEAGLVPAGTQRKP
ncbi:MAG: tripartite tricarboxylate transporter substrate binding protein [Gammaproteobacteria bacterium]|jgi:tripartite-type tricarboxylate transporter receptor subunit TctC